MPRLVKSDHVQKIIGHPEKQMVFLKSVVYRIYSSFITGLIAYFVFSQTSIKASLKLILVDMVIGFMTYYLFEIVWNRMTDENDPKPDETS
jgi:uncharacterized membrane protein